MSLPDLASIVENALLAWLAAMMALVAWRCLTGRIDLSGLLAGSGADRRPTPERVQLLLGILIAAFAYAQLALAQTQAPNAPPTRTMPEVPNEILLLFAGSHSLYLVGKHRRLQSRGGHTS
ncbi:MAG: hypothetical protein JOZ72_08695 [Alphaproteobacteria bacterium]|nr:hypothetical protein [Alphaproteobacteria bacterium]